MNTDHALSIRLYLQNYCHVPSSGTTKATLSDITPDHMILHSSYGRHVVPFDPPMKSLIEARERLVAMHNDCLLKLGLSDVVIDEYRLPRSVASYGLAALVTLILLTFPFRESLRPGSGGWGYRIWSLGGLVPGLARLSYAVAPVVLGFIVVAHAVEAVYFATSRLRRHWVQTFSGVWWWWMLDCWLQGFSSFIRFDRLVKDKEAKKVGKAQH
jgi:hypothetical protein